MSDLRDLDSRISCRWLTWESLGEAGLDLGEARAEDGRYDRIRSYFSEIPSFDRESVLERMVADGFQRDYARSLVDSINPYVIESIDALDSIMSSILIHPSTSVEYFTSRGHSFADASLLSRESRRWGVSGGHRSVRWSDVRAVLLERGHSPSRITTDVSEDSILFQSVGPKIHDDFFLSHHNLVVAYKDFFWCVDRSLEVRKAHHVVKNRGCRYVALWSDSFGSAKEFAEFVDRVALSGDEFSSTRSEDVLEYHKYASNLSTTEAWDQTFLDVADRLSLMSKCQSKKVCALAVRDRRIVATGLNGSARGSVNCCDIFHRGVDEHNREDHHAWSLKNEIHAEMSLVAEAARMGVSLEGCEIYVNLQPCAACSTYLTALNVKRIVFKSPYDKGDISYTKSLFRAMKIPFHQHKKGW